MDKKQIPIIITSIILGIILVCGAGAGGYYFGKQKGETNKEDEYKNKFEKIFPPLPETISSYRGTIKSVSEKQIQIEVPPLTSNPFKKESETLMKKVIITDQTEVVKQVLKEKSQLEKEYQVYQEARKNGVSSILPSPYSEEKISFSDLKEKDKVAVSAGENIKDKEEFEAIKIILIEAAK